MNNTPSINDVIELECGDKVLFLGLIFKSIYTVSVIYFVLFMFHNLNKVIILDRSYLMIIR